MSPAAAEFNSPTKTQSTQQPPFTPQNPNPNFTFSAFSINNLSEQHQSSFPNGFAFGPAASPSGDSAVSSRSKPRLVKRRRLGFRRGKCSTPGPPCEGSGLNSNQVNNNSSSTTDTSNGLSASIDGVMYGKFNNEAFVFGASKSGLESNLNAENKQTCSDGVGRFNDVGFVFSADRSNCGSHSNPEQKECSRDGGKCGAEEFGKSENVGNLLGDYRSSSDKNSLISGLDTEKTQSGGMGQRSSDGFVFGVYVSNFDSDHNESSSGMVKSGAKEFGESKNSGLLFGNSSSQLLYSNLENGQCCESGKSKDTVDFVFGAYNRCSTSKSDSEVKQSGSEEFSFHSKHGNLMQNSTFEERKYSENVEKLASDGRGRMNFDFGKVDDLGFVFHGNWSELRTNSNSVKNESPENGGKSVPIDNQKMKSGAQFGKFDKIDFVSSVCPEASLSTIDSEKGETSRSAGNLSFEDSGKSKDIEVEAQKAEAHDVFVFGSSSAKSSSVSESTEVGDEMSKVNPQNVRNDAGSADTYLGKLDFLINSKSNFVFGSSAHTIGASGTSTVSKLSDEMKKMTACDCKKIGCSCHMKDPSIDASACSKPVFVYGNNKKSPGYCTGKSRTTSCDQMMNESFLRHGNGSAEGFNFRTIEEDTLVFASSSDAACSFGEAAQHAMPNENNQHARSWLGDSDEQIKLGCGVFRCVWEERQPKNTNNNSSNDPSLGIPTPNPFIFQAERDIGYDGPRDQLNDHSKLNIPTNEALFPPCGLDSEALSSGRVENECNFRFANTPLGVGESVKDFRMPNVDTSCAFMVNLSPRFNKKFESSGKRRSERDKGCKNRRGKLRRAFPESRQNHLPKEDSQQQMESPRSYSPMDFTPYQDNNDAPSTSNVTSSPQGKNEDLETVSEGAISEGDKKCRGSNEEYLRSHQERVVDSSLEESQTDCSNSNTKREESDCNKQNQFCFASRENDDVERNFTFSASCTQDKLSATRRHNQKKYRMKVGHAPNTTNPSQKVDAASSSVQFPVQPHDKEGNLNSKYKGNKEDDEQGSTAQTQKTCQKWRNRGNQAYEKGNPSKAEEFYTKGINSVPHSGTSGCCIAPLVLCYSNRAAARMSLGRMREALGDCMRAAALDPNFHKVQIRAANCHLEMGEVEAALQYFSKCLETGAEVCLDRRIIIEAANGQQKAQKVAKCVNQCAELIRKRTCNAAISALEVISGVFSTSSYSEKLLEMKGEALLMLGRYEEVIRLCEQTLVFAELNVVSVAGDNNIDIVDGPTYNNSSIRLWRWHLMAKSYFHLGRLEVALDLLEKQELLRSSEDRCGTNMQESSIPFAVTVRQLLHHKNAGNEAFQSGRHTQAVEHYTAAVSSSIESRPFAAICFCNRAAAHQALGQISDAIADCSLAIALDGSYSKAVSRRATLHEKIRDYEQAASDLLLLISLFEKQSQEELTQVRRRHYSMEEKAKKGMSLDHYLILGIKQSDTASEIKKAYRKAALRHHPDKAGQFLARSESGDDGKLWKEIADEVHKDADRLFKMIGEAYAVLSDPTKRSQYDLQEELRNEQKGKNGSRGFRGSPEFYKSPSRTTANGQYRQGYRYSYYDEW
ncbi:uncharacterized protein LOC131322125 [Rhododendron vialii]|uniref:uncharacterized protein LOC131322125 n=1 Tax=Rhododendron vialii TaxID=182163 RepID=UPI00265FFD1F|nr:uncharacterized protein LOC131322125 [Rhododendron vialii]